MKDIENHNYIGDHIRQFRERKGWTQKMLGERLGKKTSTVSAYETNAKLPSANCLIAMAELFGVSLDTLVYGERADTVSLRSLSQEQREAVSSLVYEFSANSAKDEDFKRRMRLLAALTQLLNE